MISFEYAKILQEIVAFGAFFSQPKWTKIIEWLFSFGFTDSDISDWAVSFCWVSGLACLYYLDWTARFKCQMPLKDLFLFKGEFVDCQLPPKKSFGTKSQEFVESKKEVFEQYLQVFLPCYSSLSAGTLLAIQHQNRNEEWKYCQYNVSHVILYKKYISK